MAAPRKTEKKGAKAPDFTLEQLHDAMTDVAQQFHARISKLESATAHADVRRIVQEPVGNLAQQGLLGAQGSLSAGAGGGQTRVSPMPIVDRLCDHRAHLSDIVDYVGAFGSRLGLVEQSPPSTPVSSTATPSSRDVHILLSDIDGLRRRLYDLLQSIGSQF